MKRKASLHDDSSCTVGVAMTRAKIKDFGEAFDTVCYEVIAVDWIAILDLALVVRNQKVYVLWPIYLNLECMYLYKV